MGQGDLQHRRVSFQPVITTIVEQELRHPYQPQKKKNKNNDILFDGLCRLHRILIKTALLPVKKVIFKKRLQEGP